MAYSNDFTGMLARNERKQQPSHPDFSGQCEVAGVKYWLSGWIKEGKPGGKMEGKKFFSLAFKPMEAGAAGAKSSTPPPARSAPPARAPAASTPPPKQAALSELSGDEPDPF